MNSDKDKEVIDRNCGSKCCVNEKKTQRKDFFGFFDVLRL